MTAAQGVELRIENVPVKFPFEPYDQQVKYMETKVDAVLESPTGTGKTLSLLCSTLGWLQHKKCTLKVNISDVLAAEAGVAPSSGGGVGQKIYYCSRTHSQLAQVIKELNNTMYRGVRCAILGGRDQLCNHDTVRRQKENAAKNAMCRGLRKQHKCHLYNNWDKVPVDRLDQIYYDGKIPDIEDLVSIAKKNQHCAFYRSRQMVEHADIVMLPYNYLLDPNLRRIHKIDVKGNIIIFDEAHNLESICEDSASTTLTTTTLSLAIKELQEALKKREEEDEETRTQCDNSEAIYNTLPTIIKTETTLDMVKGKHILKRLFELEELIEKYYIKGKVLQDEKGMIMKPDGRLLNGEEMLRMLDTTGLGREGIAVMEFDKVIEGATSVLSDDQVFTTGGRKLEEVSTFIHTVLAGNLDANLRPHDKSSSEYKLWIHGDSRGDNGSFNEYSLNFWCFTAGVTMQSLKRQGAQSVIVTSGTLAPLETFMSRIGLDVGCTFTGEHAAKQEQVSAFRIQNGPSPDRRFMDGSYRFRDDQGYIKSIGMSIAKTAQVVPQGMLVFFPSFAVMQKMIDHWKKADVWREIERSQKFLAIEPRDKVRMAEQHREFAMNSLSQYGAIFFAVFKGKLAEGINFSDHDARAVLIVGIPYPPAFDPKILIKKEILNEQHQAWRSAKQKAEKGRPFLELEPLQSLKWYKTEAMRAVNQALGRVLRHRDDFGIVALLDCRYRTMEKTLFPSWLVPSLKNVVEFDTFTVEAGNFFKSHNMQLQKSQAKVASMVGEGGVRVKKRPHVHIQHDEAVNFDMFAEAPKPCSSAEVQPKIKVAKTSFLEAIENQSEGSSSSSTRTGIRVGAPLVKRPPLTVVGSQPSSQSTRPKLKIKPNVAFSARASTSTASAAGVTSSSSAEKKPVPTVASTSTSSAAGLTSSSSTEKKPVPSVVKVPANPTVPPHTNETNESAVAGSSRSGKQSASVFAQKLKQSGIPSKDFKAIFLPYAKTKNVSGFFEQCSKLFLPKNPSLLREVDTYLSNDSDRSEWKKLLSKTS